MQLLLEIRLDLTPKLIHIESSEKYNDRDRDHGDRSTADNQNLSHSRVSSLT